MAIDEDIMAALAEEIRLAHTPTAKEEISLELETMGFDPVFKIASILAKNRTRTNLRWYYEPALEASYNPKLRALGRRRLPQIEKMILKRSNMEKRPIYSASVMAAYEYLACGIDQRKKDTKWYGYRFELILGESKGEEDLINRAVLGRIYQTLLENQKTLPGHARFHKFFSRQLKDIIEDLSFRLYERFIADTYSRLGGDMKSEAIPVRGKRVHIKEEEYQSTAPGLTQINPKAIIASNVIYDMLEGYEKRIERLNSRFDLLLLLGTKAFASRLKSSRDKKILDGMINGDRDMRTVFSYTSALLQYERLKG